MSSPTSAACRLLLILLAVSSPLAAQGTGTITGVVVDRLTGLTLAGAAVQVESSGQRTVTDAQGRFAILRVSAGPQTLESRYVGYAPGTISTTVEPGRVARVEFALDPRAVELAGIEVVGQQVGQAAALNQQLNALNISNVVAADQIGRFPDANIGDALKRIPGISVQQDQGEARFGSVRGTEPRLNSVTLNGERIPSAEADVRQVQLDLIPSDMVSAVEVNKVLTPDMDADAVGASVNVVTRSAPVAPRLSLTIGGQYNQLREKAAGTGSAVFTQRLAGGRLGIVLNGAWQDHELGSDDLEAVWAEEDGQVFTEEIDVRRYDIRRLRQSIGASLDYQLGAGSTLFYRGLYNHRNDWERRFRLTYEMDAPDEDGVQATELVRQLKGGVAANDFGRLEDQRVQSHQLAGQHLLPGATVDWSVSIARASEERPNERYIVFANEDAQTRVDLANAREPLPTLVDPSADDPANLEFDEITEEYQFTRDLDRNGRLDITLPLDGGRTTVKVGARYRDKSKLRENNFFEYSPLDGLETMADASTADFSRAGFLAGPYQVGRGPTPEYFGGLDLSNGALFEQEDKPDEYLPANFDADERILGGYLSIARELSPRTTALVGVRFEQTDVDYNGYDFDLDEETATPTTGTQSYGNLFPSVVLRHELGDRTILRAGWTNTIARPNYYDLVPYRLVSFEDQELEIGNPALKPTRSMNFDVMLEHYFGGIGMVSGGVYYKDITDFIYGYNESNYLDPVTGFTFDQVLQPQNGASATLIGFELAFQRRLIGGLSVYGNYSFTDSDVSGFPIADRDGENLPLPGTSRHTLNASLAFDTDRISIRASLNFQDDFLDPDGGVGDAAFYDRWYDRSTTLDLNGEFVVTPRARFFFNANNLTNQPLRYYQGTRARTMQGEYYDVRFQAGVKLELR